MLRIDAVVELIVEHDEHDGLDSVGNHVVMQCSWRIIMHFSLLRACIIMPSGSRGIVDSF